MVLKQSTVKNLAVFMASSTDHVTGKTGLTLTITASKDAAAFASITPTVTELATGWYKLALTTSHTDTLGDLALHITGTGADPTDLLRHVVAYDFADAVRLGLTALPNAAAGANSGLPLGDASGRVDLGKWLGTAAEAPTTAGRPNVNAKSWNDLATVALPLAPATAGRTLVVDAAGLADANMVKSGPTGSGTAQTARDLGGTLGAAGAGLSAIPTVARVTLVDTSTALTNAPSAGDFTATMKTSVTTAATAATPTAAAVTGAVGSVAGNVGGNVTGSVGSVASFGTLIANIITAIGTAFGVGSYLRNTEPDNTGIGVAAAAAASAASDASTLVGRLTATRAGYLDKLNNLPEGIKKNTALNNFTFYMVDSTTKAAAPGLTVTATRRLDGGSFSACANAPTEIANGYYTIDFAAADLNGDMVCVIFSATGADDAGFEAKLSA